MLTPCLGVLWAKSQEYLVHTQSASQVPRFNTSTPSALLPLNGSALFPPFSPPPPRPLQAARRGRRLPPAVERLALVGSALLVAVWAAALSVGDVVALADSAAGRLGVSGGAARVLGK